MAIVKTIKKADKFSAGKYLVIDSNNGRILINEIFNIYSLARKNASLYNKNKLSISDILNIQ